MAIGTSNTEKHEDTKINELQIVSNDHISEQKDSIINEDESLEKTDLIEIRTKTPEMAQEKITIKSKTPDEVAQANDSNGINSVVDGDHFSHPISEGCENLGKIIEEPMPNSSNISTNGSLETGLSTELLDKILSGVESMPENFSNMENQIEILSERLENLENNSMQELNSHIGEIQGVISMIAAEMNQLKDAWGGNLTQLQENMSRLIVDSQCQIQNRLTAQLEIERKIQEVRESEILQKLTGINKAKSGGKNASNFGGFPFMFSSLGRSFMKINVGSQGAKKKEITFDIVARIIRHGHASREKVLQSIDKLIIDLNLDSQINLKDVFRIVKKVVDRIDSDKSGTISPFTRDYLLTQIEHAEILYKRIVNKGRKPSPKEILISLDNLIKRLYLTPSGISFKNLLYNFRKMLAETDPDFNPSLLKEIKSLEQELTLIGEKQLSYLHQTRYRTQLINWKRYLERILGKMGHKFSTNELIEILQKILVRINAFPLTTELRNQFGELRAIIVSMDFTAKNWIRKECEEIETKLVQMGNRRIIALERDNYRKILFNWKKEVLVVQDQVKDTVLDSLIDWADNILKLSEQNMDAVNKDELAVYRLVLLLKKLEPALIQGTQNSSLLKDYHELIQDQEKRIYEYITIPQVKILKDRFKGWISSLQQRSVVG